VLSRWQGGLAAIVVTLLAAVLVVLDINDGAMRRWWDGHALTTDTVSGLLVLLITLLVVDQVVSLRQINDRARAVAAMMLLVAAPVLIDVRVSRAFLEQAQFVAAEMARALGVTARSHGPGTLADARLDSAVQQLRPPTSAVPRRRPGRRRVRIWDVATRQEIGAPMTAGIQPVYAAAFGPGGGTLATAGGDGAARTWDVAFPANLVPAACGIASGSLTRQQWADYAGSQPFQQVCPAG